MKINKLFEEMIKRGASDMHLRAGLPPVLRIKKDLVRTDFPIMGKDEIAENILDVLDVKSAADLREKLQCDFSYSVAGLGRFRGAAFYQRGTVAAVFRAIPDAPSDFESLGLPLSLEKITEANDGIVLVTGPAGHGKSTTLAAMISHINNTRHAHIITLEDPIEYFFKDNKSIVTQRELGGDMLSYAEALKNIVREDPDVILIGEMRDLDTISSGVTAAEVGNLVFSTVHTINAYQTISRIIDFFPVSHQNQMRIQISESLRAIISMRLMKSKDGSHMVPVCEILINTEAVKKLIAENTLSEIYDLMAKGSYYGMQTFNQDLFNLCEKDIISEEDALGVSTNPEEFRLYMRGVDTTTAATGFSSAEDEAANPKIKRNF
ncbi:type IV pilus twitching motility protein PilT [bacterium]|nr:type IV pilus twitching motility protein PilT [bacterium]MBU3955369.1 type IV pilus twitching motility protein PilT [bacterium]MBU4134733.1 type IV pilus twitching motility protein PilT [bacterium]